MVLVALGFRSISMAPANIGPVKAMILSLDAGRMRSEMLKLVDSEEPKLRQRLLELARAAGVEIDATSGELT
jgi:phosphotransferase system enzyme I (PtsP)